MDDFQRQMRDMAARAEVITFAMYRARNAPNPYKYFLPSEVVSQTSLKMKQVMPVIDWLVERGILMRDSDLDRTVRSAKTRRYKITTDAFRAIDGPGSDFTLNGAPAAFGDAEA